MEPRDSLHGGQQALCIFASNSDSRIRSQPCRECERWQTLQELVSFWGANCASACGTGRRAPLPLLRGTGWPAWRRPRGPGCGLRSWRGAGPRAPGDGTLGMDNYVLVTNEETHIHWLHHKGGRTGAVPVQPRPGWMRRYKWWYLGSISLRTGLILKKHAACAPDEHPSRMTDSVERYLFSHYLWRRALSDRLAAGERESGRLSPSWMPASRAAGTVNAALWTLQGLGRSPKPTK